MDLLSFFMKFLAAQGVVAVIIIFFLKRNLDRELYDIAIQRLEFLSQAERFPSFDHVMVVSHKDLSPQNKGRIQKAVSKHFTDSVKPVFKIDKKILGGIIITVADQTFAYSLKHRLSLVFSGKEGS